MKCLYLLSVVFHVAAGCALSGVNYQKEITQHKGGSVLLPCSCSDLLSKPQKLTWWIFRTGHWTEVLNEEHYRGRYQLFNNISPANLSLLISDLSEEDEGDYRCSTELQEHVDFKLYVKGCELVKTVVEEVTGFIGESVVLPCVCTDIQDDPKRVTWEFNKNNHFQEIYPEQTGHHSNRVKLVSKNPPGNLSLLISDLTEEDQGIYRCSVQADHRDLSLSVKGRRETSTQSRKTDKTQPESKTTTSPPSSSSTTQVGRKKTSTQQRKLDKTPPSEQPQSKTTSSPPASSITTPEHDKQQPPFFGIVAVLLLVIPVVVAFICWRRKAGRSRENVITEGRPDHKGNQEDQTVPDVTYSTVTHINTAGAARVQINDGEETEYASIIKN